MRNSIYRDLPLDALYELLTDGTIKLLDACDSREDNAGEFKAQKKYIESLLQAIREKKKGAVEKISAAGTQAGK